MTRECSQEYEEVTEQCPVEGQWTPKESHETQYVGPQFYFYQCDNS